MAMLTPRQVTWRRRVEAGLRIAGPVLDLVLAVGDRISRVAGRSEPDPEPPRRMSGPVERTPLEPARDRGR